MPHLSLKRGDPYYERAGARQPVILIPGLGAGYRSWGMQVLGLTRHFELIAVENSGIGRSRPSVNGLSIGMMATDIGVLIDELGIEVGHFVRSSMASMIAFEFALRNPNRIASVTLCSPPIAREEESYRAFTSNLRRSVCNGEMVKVFHKWPVEEIGQARIQPFVI